MYMKLKKPEEVKQLLARKHGWLTHKEIAAGIQVSSNTINGHATCVHCHRSRPATVHVLARAVDKEPMSIAEFV